MEVGNFVQSLNSFEAPQDFFFKKWDECSHFPDEKTENERSPWHQLNYGSQVSQLFCIKQLFFCLKVAHTLSPRSQQLPNPEHRIVHCSRMNTKTGHRLIKFIAVVLGQP